MLIRKILAWCVHFYTASGLIAAGLMAVMIFRGDAVSLNWAIGLMIVATFIDSTDGFFARRLRVREVLPQFDGRRLDDIVDFQTYTSLPILFIWRAGILPENLSIWLLVPLLASVYGFSQENAKTEDNFFLGFPSYWNAVAIYLYWLHPDVWISLTVILGLAVLTFVPSVYLYPSKGGPYARLTGILTLIWGGMLVVIVAKGESASKTLIQWSLAFPIYYMGLSWLITLQRWSGKPDHSNGQAGRLATLTPETSPAEE